MAAECSVTAEREREREGMLGAFKKAGDGAVVGLDGVERMRGS